MSLKFMDAKLGRKLKIAGKISEGKSKSWSTVIADVWNHEVCQQKLKDFFQPELIYNSVNV